MMESDNPTSQFPSTPPPTSPSSTFATSITPRRSPGDECFRCKKLGHWANQCPNRTPQKSPTSSPGSTGNGSDLPLVRCPCDRGACRVFTSRTLKNPDRKFYICPVDESMGKCKFFKWCDELSEKVPVCPCGVGKCSLNRKSSGPDEGKWYFSCRIRKNYGACDYFQWADPAINAMMNRHAGQSKCYNLPSLFNNANARHPNEDEVPNREDEVPNRDPVVMQEVEPCESITGEALQVYQPMAPSKRRRLSDAWKNVSDAGDTITEGIFPSFDPVTEDEDTPNLEGPVLLPHTGLSAQTEESPSQTLGQDSQVQVDSLNEPSAVNGPSGIMQDDDVLSKSILKKLGQSLLNIFESMNHPLDPEKMQKVAEAFFTPLKNLSIECGSFVEDVKKYINNVMKLTSIEGSMSNHLSNQELSNLHDIEKVRFDNISHLHTETLEEYKASINLQKSLEEEVSRIKGLLVQLEEQLFCCEAETSGLKARVDEVTKDLAESKRTMEAVALDMEKALEFERQRELLSNAAKTALQTAKAKLE